MAQSDRREARVRVKGQLIKRHEALMAREARIRTEVLDAAAALLTRDRAALEAEARLGKAIEPLTSSEGMPIDEAAELCGLHVKEAKRVLRKRVCDPNRQELAEEVANS
ncbi:hypothetical protein [Tessaracoccus lapidicaptus]|uniref:hypothetical protein n=1 Tax=Tessaracoccus lapidicaptus TaxID=1427523 RepID=UPI00333EE738